VRRRAATFCLAGLLGLTVMWAPLAAQEPGPEVREVLRDRLEAWRAAEAAGLLEASGDLMWQPQAAFRFYEQRGFWPAWSRDGTLLPVADSLLSALRRAGEDGLRSADYHVDRAQAMLETLRAGSPPPPGELADLDLLLTDAYLAYASHLLAGRLEPVTLAPQFVEAPEGIDLPERLADALASDDVRWSLSELVGDSEAGYRLLRTALAQYRALAARGDWPSIPEGAVLEVGAEGIAVMLLRRRLAATGDYPPPADEDDDRAGDPVVDSKAFEFAAGLEVALRRFQRRHGLLETGAVDPMTRAALNVSPGRRARQIEVNLERWRWLPHQLGGRYVLVNIADFQGEVVERGRRMLQMRAIVGSAYKQTPVFSDSITYLVFNPSWRVPRDITRDEMIPLIRHDPGYLEREKLRIIGPDGERIDPVTIDWAVLNPSRLPWRLEQAPGPRNVLGRVKFMFPNPYDVYLHGTPQPELFQHAIRAFSHGCIRLERPLDLARYLLGTTAGWNQARIDEVLASGRETTVTLVVPVPVYLEYWTAWVEPDGTVQFRDDIYQRDHAVEQALDAQ